MHGEFDHLLIHTHSHTFTIQRSEYSFFLNLLLIFTTTTTREVP
jgi:hypothetical protein